MKLPVYLFSFFFTKEVFSVHGKIGTTIPIKNVYTTIYPVKERIPCMFDKKVQG